MSHCLFVQMTSEALTHVVSYALAFIATLFGIKFNSIVSSNLKYIFAERPITPSRIMRPLRKSEASTTR